MPVRKSFWGAVVSINLLGAAAGQALAAVEDDYEMRNRDDVEVQLPAPPRQQSLVSFYVSPTTDNRFFVDSSSISVGDDGVVRYTLVVLAPGGASNISYEGMRCETREKRLYAFGRADGTWSRARGKKWERVTEAVNNRQHAALFQDFFCPDGVIVKDAKEAKDALARGGKSSPMRW